MIDFYLLANCGAHQRNETFLQAVLERSYFLYLSDIRGRVLQFTFDYASQN